METLNRQPYAGSTRKLVLAFDIGTTFSGISYSILDPGQVPVIKGVTKFPAQETISGASKIPSQIIYDQDGNVRAVGAEAIKEGMVEMCQEEGWTCVQWFKLHLRANTPSTSHYQPHANDRDLPISQTITPLPPSKTIVDVYADFLSYLFRCAKTYICDTHAQGKAFWDTIQHSEDSTFESSIDYVLSHPNGWDRGGEQNVMREAMVKAGLIQRGLEGWERVAFVEEGEASLHFAICGGGVLSAQVVKRGGGVVVVDAGGGTIDVSAYRNNLEKSEEGAFEEIAPAQCHLLGSLFVSFFCGKFLRDHLAHSPYVDDVDQIVQKFDETTKKRFSNEGEPQYIKFGTNKDNDPQRGIKFGQLKLAGTDVAGFFKPALECIIRVVHDQRRAAHHPVSHVILVGGFSANDWIFRQVEARLSEYGLTVIRPDNHVNKAVSDGAVSFYLDHHVRSRVSKVVYGIFYTVNFNPKKASHVSREAMCVTSMTGEKLLPNAFSIILKKGVQVHEEREFRKDFFRLGKSPQDFSRISATVQAYHGCKTDHPDWKDVDPDNYTPLCTISADLSRIPNKKCVSSNGTEYYKVKYDIVLLFGLTELRAFVAWDNNGVEERGPAKIVFHSRSAYGSGSASANGSKRSSRSV